MSDSPNDSAGNPITVGATVKLVGVVTSIDLLSNRFHDIKVTISHPLASSAGTPKDASTNYMEGTEMTPPGYRQTLAFPPGVLTLGS